MVHCFILYIFYLLLFVFNHSEATFSASTPPFSPNVAPLSGASPFIDCPRGKYRKSPYILECSLCPEGYFGSTSGLNTSSCSGPCPIGTYSNERGLMYPDQCKPVSENK